jgi:excisionase family DNA binding protein
MSDDTPKCFLNPAQAAALLGVSEKTVRDYAKRSIVPARKLGKHWRFLEAELLECGTKNQCSTNAIAAPVMARKSMPRIRDLPRGRVTQIARRLREKMR